MTVIVALLRRGLLLILLISLIGTLAELLLLRHTDGFWQWFPIGLVVAALFALAWYAVSLSAISLRALQGIMWLFVASGIIGSVQHFVANLGFERESNPSLSGFELYWSALQGATPSLAPGIMIPFGMLGLLFLLRHPRLSRSGSPEE